MDAPPPPPAAPARPTVVVTNHDPVFLALLEQLLREEGYDPRVPPKLEEPYPFVKAVRPAAVVLDVPFRRETETLATLDKLRLDPATAATPVVVCTTSPGSLDGLTRREGEGLYVLAKPFDLERLLAVLATALRGRPARGRAG
jgi:DNA-binding response OmpR family regulator